MMLKTDKAAMAYLSKKDARLREVIEQIGPIERPMREDLFEALIRQIVGQQISIKAMWTVWGRVKEKFNPLTPENLLAANPEDIQACGLSYRKVSYIRTAAEAVFSKEVDLETLPGKSDEEVIQELTKLKGIGRWTAEMLLIFTLGRPDVLAWDDLAIHRGMRMVYHHRRVTREQFEKYRRRYSPHGSTASLYLWEVAMGTLPNMKDYAPLSEAEKQKRKNEREKAREVKQKVEKLKSASCQDKSEEEHS